MTDAPRKQWPATYYDGESAVPHELEVTLTPLGLAFWAPDGKSTLWPYAEVQQTAGQHAGEPVRFEHGGPLGRTLVIAEPGFLEALRAVSRKQGRFAGPLGQREALLAGGLALVALVGASVGLYRWGIPAIADVVAERVPIAWEEQLGKHVVESMVPESKRCTDKASVAALERIVTTLTANQQHRYTYRVAIARDSQVNAFAAPGGYVVVNTGLLEKARSPEEVAGVLAHEIQHVQQRHATKAILRQLSLQAILTAVTGDMGALGAVIGAAGELGTLGYARAAEEEADREGMRLMMAARLDPKGMIGMFETLQAATEETPGVLQVLSTHPDTAARIAKLKTQSASARYAPVPLLADLSWKGVASGCR